MNEAIFAMLFAVLHYSSFHLSNYLTEDRMEKFDAVMACASPSWYASSSVVAKEASAKSCFLVHVRRVPCI